MKKNNKRGLRILGGMVIIYALALWTSGGFFTADLLAVLDPVSLVWLIHLIALIALAPMFLTALLRLFKYKKRYVLALILIGAGGSALASVAFFFALRIIEPPYVLAPMLLQPLIAIAAAHVLLKERQPKFFIWLIAAAIIGAIAVSWPGTRGLIACLNNTALCVSSDALRSPPLFAPPNLLGRIGMLMAATAVCLWALAMVLGRYVSAAVPPRDIIFGRFFFGFVFMFTWLFVGGLNDRLYDFAGVLFSQPILGAKLLYLALITGLLGMFMFYHGLRRVPAKMTALLELLFPILTIVFASYAFGTPLHVVQIAGLCVFSIAIIFCFSLPEARSRKQRS